MSSFSAAWLALREPHDRRARNAEVLDAVVTAFASHISLNVADIGCGTGSTHRALSPRLPPGQRWRLYDNDLSLLARATGPADVTTVPLIWRAISRPRSMARSIWSPRRRCSTSSRLPGSSASPPRRRRGACRSMRRFPMTGASGSIRPIR